MNRILMRASFTLRDGTLVDYDETSAEVAGVYVEVTDAQQAEAQRILKRFRAVLNPGKKAK